MPENRKPMSLAAINFRIMISENRYRDLMNCRGSKWHDQSDVEAQLESLQHQLIELYKQKKLAEGFAADEKDGLMLERDFFEDMLRRQHELYLEQQREACKELHERKRKRGFDMER